MSAAARQRLEMLGRDFGRPLEAEETVPFGTRSVLVPEPGRHALKEQRRVTTTASRVLARMRERVAWTPAHLAVVAVLASAGLAVAAWSVLRASPREIPAPASGPASSLVASPTPGSTQLLVGPGSVTPDPSPVVIDIAGRVRRPGVATLPNGSRVVDALKHAGGARRGVDLTTLNLARILVDGEQILVGSPAASGPAAAGAQAAPPASAMVNLNTASQEVLESLPGVGPVTAAKILAWRSEHGGFTAVEELLDVAGIGPKTLAELAPHVTL